VTLNRFIFRSGVKVVLKQAALDIGIVKLNPSAGTQTDRFG